MRGFEKDEGLLVAELSAFEVELLLSLLSQAFQFGIGPMRAVDVFYVGGYALLIVWIGMLTLHAGRRHDRRRRQRRPGHRGRGRIQRPVGPHRLRCIPSVAPCHRTGRRRSDVGDRRRQASPHRLIQTN